MSLVRNTAVRVANLVVRYASIGSKEWAQAISNELTSIESDWRALAWALGGVRVLFTIQPSPLPTIADLDSEVQKYADRRRHAVNNGWLITNLQLFPPLMWSFNSALSIAEGRHVLGNYMQIFGWLLTLPMTYLRTREPDVPDRDDQPGLVRFYLKELSTFSKYSVPFCMFVAGLLLVMCGLELTLRRGWLSLMPLTLLPVLVLLLAAHLRSRRRFAQVKALLASNPTD